MNAIIWLNRIDVQFKYANLVDFTPNCLILFFWRFFFTFLHWTWPAKKSNWIFLLVSFFSFLSFDFVFVDIYALAFDLTYSITAVSIKSISICLNIDNNKQHDTNCRERFICLCIAFVWGGRSSSTHWNVRYYKAQQAYENERKKTVSLCLLLCIGWAARTGQCVHRALSKAQK